MKVFIRILAALAVLLVVLVVSSFFLPRVSRVERSISINAPAEAIYPRCADLREWKTWAVWYERDPAMSVRYSTPPDGVGSWAEWHSETQGGVGKMTITALEAPSRVVYRLEFPAFDSRSTGTLVFRAEGAGTTVVWTDESDLGMSPMKRWMGLFLDKMIGSDFEAGLAKLKRTSEAPQ